MSLTCKVPQLRFGEFSEEWEEKKLGEIITLMQSGLSRLLSDTDIGLPVIRSNNLIEGRLNTSDIKYWYKDDNQGANTENYYLKSGDLLVNFINSIAQIGKVARFENVFNRDIIFTTNIMRLRFKDSISSCFIFNFFHTQTYKKHIQNITKPAVNQASFTTKDFNQLAINLPSLPEQEKIASFLSSVDTKIEQLTKKKTLLEQYKKGVMQKIFSQEIRFKDDDGSEYPEWVEKKLGEVGIITTGKTPSTTDANLWDGNIKFITPTDIKDNVKYQINVQRTVTKQSAMKVLEVGSIVYTCIASIGKMAITKYPSITNQQINSVTVNKNNNNEFIYYQLLELTPYIQSTQANTTLPIINKTEFSKFKIKLPSLKEQIKIANFLSSLDSKLYHVSQQLDATKQFKKALLQKMFV